MKINLILTGGTIASRDENGTIITDRNTGIESAILDEYADIDFSISSPFITASENMSIEQWNLLVEHIEQLEKYDGIIITTGTDTLAYTAAMLSLAFSGSEVPIILVSANHVLSDHRSNGRDNFAAALKIIKGGLPPDIYVPYRNTDGVTYIHRGCHLNQSRGLVPDFFSASYFGRIGQNGDLEVTDLNISPLMLTDVKFTNTLLAISPYIGIEYDRYDLTNCSGVIHELYHAGTASETIGVLKKKCDERGIPLFIAPLKNAAKYNTTADMVDSGIIPVYNMTWEMSYAKVLLALSLGIENIAEFLEAEINGEFI